MMLDTPVGDTSRSLKIYAARLEKLGIITLRDLLYYVPFRYDNFSLISKIVDIQPGEVVTIQANVNQIDNIYTRSRKKIQKALLSDETGLLEVIWFNQPFLTKYIHKGDRLSVSGKIDIFAGKIALQSPEYEILTENGRPLHTGRLVPIYPETKGVTSKWLRRQIYGALDRYAKDLIDYLPQDIQTRRELLHFQDAIRGIHFPESPEIATKARERLAFDELFFMQLRSRKRRQEWETKTHGQALEVEKFQTQIHSYKKSLPFLLTNAQENATKDILTDLSNSKPMNRLLQGDVGSGKTVVASIAAYTAHLNGYQIAVLAPTEILANQHYLTLKQFLSPFGIQVELRTGSTKTIRDKQKEISKKKIHDSKYLIQNTHILVGTHALLHESVQFEKLGLVVIDEQQRFGVEQRSIIRKKGNNPHILTMTATPIPRTVALTMYGDLDLSYLSEMPKGRKMVKTWLTPNEKRENAYGWIRKELKEHNSQAFIICPFIEDSESMTTVKAAKTEFERLQKDVFPDLRLSLLHGRMKGKEKDIVLSEFKEKRADILVATPVVEVGIDVPNATIIVIEAAERFGLAQLHQLRGRVGRGDKQSYCLLFTESLSEMTTARLKAMETSHVGAELAELDLKLRGPGDMFGTTQHGLPKLKVASFSDFDLIEKVRKEADLLFPNLQKYPELEKLITDNSSDDVSPD